MKTKDIGLSPPMLSGTASDPDYFLGLKSLTAKGNNIYHSTRDQACIGGAAILYD